MRQMVIAVDTREKTPFLFKGHQSMKATLVVGDYSLRGLENKIAVERKAISDMWGTLSQRDNYARFSRELERARDLGIPLWIVVESSVASALAANVYTGMNPFRVMDRLHHLCFKYGTAACFAGGKKEAEIVTLSILRGAWGELVDPKAIQ